MFVRKFKMLMIYSFLVTVILAPMNSHASSISSSPIAAVKQVVGETLKILESRTSQDTFSDAELAQLKKISRDNVNYRYMAAHVLGRSGWKSLDSAQRDLYWISYRDWLENYIIKQLSKYSGQTVTYEQPQLKRTLAIVPVKIFNPNTNKTSEITFKLKEKNSKWKVIDFSVEGVSIPRAPQHDFRELIKRPHGFEKIIARLKELSSNANFSNVN